MFHVISLVCFLVYGVKTRSGHDRGWVQWSFGTNFYDFQWKKATYDSWLEHAWSIASSAWARLLHRLFGLFGWVGNHRQLFLGPALAWHNPKRFCWGMALTENATLAVGSFIVSSSGNGWTMTRYIVSSSGNASGTSHGVVDKFASLLSSCHSCRICDVDTFIWHATMCLIMTLLCYSLLSASTYI